VPRISEVWFCEVLFGYTGMFLGLAGLESGVSPSPLKPLNGVKTFIVNHSL